MTIARRKFLGLAAGAATAPFVSRLGWAQQAYPTKNISLIVPFTPGGSTDILARLLGQNFQDSMKVSVIAENRAGAGGSIGTAAVARAAPDGYTLALGHIGTLSVNPSLYPNLPYDPVKGLAHISMMAKVHNVLAVNPKLPIKNIKELIAYAKANPGLKYGSGGIGSAAHITTEAFALETGTKLSHVPYRGTAPAVVDLISGQIDMIITGAPAILQHAQNGSVRALGTASLTRLSSAPDIPTIADEGVPGFEASQWYGLVAPAGTPEPIVTKLNTEVRNALKDPKSVETLLRDGAEPWPMSPAEFRDHIAKEIPRWKKVVDAGKITVDQ